VAQRATLRLTGAQVLWAVFRRDLGAEAARLGAIVGRQLRVAVEAV
jgi:hypothetical protein